MDKKTKTKVFQAIRNSFKESDRYQEELNQSLSKQKGPRGGKRYTCRKCDRAFEAKQVELNHIEPVTEYHKRTMDYTIEEYYQRVFSLEVETLCKECHKSVTKEQNKKRK